MIRGVNGAGERAAQFLGCFLMRGSSVPRVLFFRGISSAGEGKGSSLRKNVTAGGRWEVAVFRCVVEVRFEK